MRRIFLFLAPYLALFLAGCSRKPVEQVSTDIRTEVRYEKILIPDTVYVEVPEQTAERTTPDSTSELENDYATSTARIMPDGNLYHDLKTKPQKKPVPTEREIVYRDSIVYRDRTKTVTVSVERELSWWQKVLMYAGGFAMVFVVFRDIMYRIKSR